MISFLECDSNAHISQTVINHMRESLETWVQVHRYTHYIDSECQYKVRINRMPRPNQSEQADVFACSVEIQAGKYLWKGPVGVDLDAWQAFRLSVENLLMFHACENGERNFTPKDRQFVSRKPLEIMDSDSSDLQDRKIA